MNLYTRTERKKNPRENANFFSIVTFTFTFPLFRKSLKRDLEDNDIYDVLPNFSSKKLGEKLEQIWNRQQKKTKQPSLYRALFYCFGRQYFLLGLMQLIVKIALIFIQPAIMSKILAHFQPADARPTESDLYIYIVLLIGLNVSEIIYYQNYYQFVTEEGIKIRTALTALIYRKALRLGSHHLTETTMGKVVTLITKDVFAFEQLVVLLNDAWIYLIEAMVVCYLIYSRIGVSVFSGTGFLLAMFLVQCECFL
nr:multidrug resistance-associated protein 4-like [Leptinotarsa decemlineata]